MDEQLKESTKYRYYLGSITSDTDEENPTTFNLEIGLDEKEYETISSESDILNRFMGASNYYNMIVGIMKTSVQFEIIITFPTQLEIWVTSMFETSTLI